MMRGSLNKTTQVLLIGALAAGSGAAIAREPAAYSSQIAHEAGVAAGETLSDDALHRFIDAAHEIVALREAYAERMAQAAPEDRLELEWQAHDRMVEAVRAQGIELGEYRRIGRLLDADDGLAEGLDALARAPS